MMFCSVNSASIALPMKFQTKEMSFKYLDDALNQKTEMWNVYY